MITQNFFETYENWFKQNCKENLDELCKIALPKIEADIEKKSEKYFSKHDNYLSSYHIAASKLAQDCVLRRQLHLHKRTDFGGYENEITRANKK